MTDNQRPPKRPDVDYHEHDRLAREGQIQMMRENARPRAPRPGERQQEQETERMTDTSKTPDDAAQLRLALEASTFTYEGHRVQRVLATFAENVHENTAPEDDRSLVLEVICEERDLGPDLYSLTLTTGYHTWELTDGAGGHEVELSPEQIVEEFPGLVWRPVHF